MLANNGRVLDLFCGAAGGWSLGLHRAGYSTAAACEIDPWRRAVFGHNNPGAVLYDDIRTLTGDRLAADGIKVDVVVGSPPCQDASTANAKGRGVDGERTGLFFEAIRIVGETRPIWACLENVPGLRVRGLDRVLAELEALDYACWPLAMAAANVGAPHRRQRLWIVVADANKLPKLPLRGGIAGLAWPASKKKFEWNGAAFDFGRVDDGLSAALAAQRGLGRRIVSAYGDAVVPQITEAIGRVMARLSPIEMDILSNAS